MGSSIGKGAMAAGAGGGVFGSIGGLVSALGLKALAIFSAGFLLVGSIGGWWFHSGASTAYYASLTTAGDINSITGDDATLIKSGNPVLVAIAIERHLKGSSLNDYDYNDPIMQVAIKYWKGICGGFICSYALPSGMLDTGKGFDNCHGGGSSPSGCGSGLQCAMFVSTVFGIAGHALPATGNAIDYWNRSDIRGAFEKAGWDYINNGSGMPSIGDLVVMGGSQYGHILVVVGVDLPQNGKKGAVYMAQANAPGNTEVNGTPLLKWPLRTDGFAEQTWGSPWSVKGFIHNDKLSKQWGDPFHSGYEGSGDAKCDKSHPAMKEDQARALAQQAGFSGHGLDVIIAIAHAESSLNPKNCLTNTDSYRSVDRGILQINNHWHPEVSDACAFDPLCAFQAGYKISSGGKSFSPWATYTSGAYRRFMP